LFEATRLTGKLKIFTFERIFRLNHYIRLTADQVLILTWERDRHWTVYVGGGREITIGRLA